MDNAREVITYDYKTITVKRQMETMAADAYENLGWEFIGSSLAGGSIFNVNLSFKRDRKIADKQKLLKLQERIDNTLQHAEALLGKKRTAGMIPALTVGIAGALIFGGGMSMVLTLIETVGFVIGGVALGIAGLGVALLAWPIYKKVRKTTLAKIEPILEDEFNRLADICEEARV